MKDMKDMKDMKRGKDGNTPTPASAPASDREVTPTPKTDRPDRDRLIAVSRAELAAEIGASQLRAAVDTLEEARRVHGLLARHPAFDALREALTAAERAKEHLRILRQRMP